MADLKNLISFVQVVKRGSFSVAAEHLGVTPPAISKNIARLEEDLGVRLFNRSTRHLNLTSEGRDFFVKVSASMDEIDGAIDDIKNAIQEPQGQLRVAVEALFGRYCLMPVIADFFVRYPKVDLELDSADVAQDLLERGIDVGIRHGHGNQTSYVSRRLPLDYPLILVASPIYLARRGVPRCIEDLADHDCIGATLLNKSSPNWKLIRIHEHSKSSGTDSEGHFFSLPKGRLTLAAHYDNSLIAALHDIGISISPLPAALPHLESGQLKVVLPDYRVQNTSATDNQLFILYPHRQYLPPKVRVFIEFLLEKFSTNNDTELNSIKINEFSA